MANKHKVEFVEDIVPLLDVFLPMICNKNYIWVVKKQKYMQVQGLGYRHFHWVLLISGGCVQIASYLDTWALKKEEFTK